MLIEDALDLVAAVAAADYHSDPASARRQVYRRGRVLDQTGVLPEG